MTTIKAALEQDIQTLARKQERQAARLDAQILLAHVLDVNRSTFYAYPERELSPEQLAQFMALVQRRLQHEPIAYITGQREFYGRDFLVDSRVLIPRPETELLVEEALQTIRGKIAGGMLPVVADIGTGSGAIPVTLAVEEPHLPYLYACDISAAALEVARANSERYHVEQRIRFLQGDLLAPLPEPVDVLTANLPYVGTDEMAHMTSDVLVYEPHLALFSGPEGLHLLQRFCEQALHLHILKPAAVILLEIGYRQCEPLTNLLQTLFPHATVTCKQDYAGWNRLLCVELE